ncbi:MAG: type 4a pilus biogenesis protein PilO [Candidatus Omnitrophota bacterium]|nr:type 4a pilus biogenesis protein PilO [Candidatus Omnitrophota bacterium]
MITLAALNKRERILLGVSVFLFLFAMYIRLIYRPTLKSFREFKKQSWDSKNQITNLTSQFADINEKKVVLEEEKNNYQKLQKELDAYEDKLFSQAQLGSLLRKITESGAAHKLDFISIAPKKKETQELYLRFPVEVKLSSPYSSFLDYLKELERISEVLKVKSLNIELDKAVSENPTVLIELSTVLSDRPAAAGQAKVVSLPSEAIKLFTPDKPAPLASSAKLEGVELNGIIWKGAEPTAIINNQIVRAGSAIGKKKVVEITQDSVILQEGDIKYTLKIAR